MNQHTKVKNKVPKKRFFCTKRKDKKIKREAEKETRFCDVFFFEFSKKGEIERRKEERRNSFWIRSFERPQQDV